MQNRRSTKKYRRSPKQLFLPAYSRTLRDESMAVRSVLKRSRVSVRVHVPRSIRRQEGWFRHRRDITLHYLIIWYYQKADGSLSQAFFRKIFLKARTSYILIRRRVRRLDDGVVREFMRTTNGSMIHFSLTDVYVGKKTDKVFTVEKDHTYRRENRTRWKQLLAEST